MAGVSIICCTYNDSHFLKKCLPSCLKQNMDKEIIIVDDASSKPLDPFVTEFIAQHGAKYIRHDKNMGLSGARNTGVSNAKYDLCIPMDADDFFYDDVFPPMVTAMTDDVDVIYGNVTDSGITHYPIKEQLTKEHFLRDNPLFCSSLFRKKVWHAAGGYEVLPHAHYEDWGFWCRAFKNGIKFKYIPLTVYEHTNRPDSMLKQLHPNRARFVEIATRELR